MTRTRRFLIVLLAGVVVALIGCGRQDAGSGAPTAGPSQQPAQTTSGTVTIGSKNFTEQILIAEIMAQMLEKHTNLQVKRTFNLGSTFVCFNALKKGELDLYADYTGTGLVAILKRDVKRDPQEVYDEVKKAYEDKYGLTWLKPFGFNNTYTLTMRKKHANELSVETMSDLKPHASELVLGCTYEFLERPDGAEGLEDWYGFEFKEKKGMDPGLTYRAVASGKVDVIDGFLTDGRIPAFDLKILKDDKNFFPPYHAAPVVRMDTLNEHPEIADVLNRLEERISTDTMRQMNYEIDEGGKDHVKVAREFLRSEGLLQPRQASEEGAGE